MKQQQIKKKRGHDSRTAHCDCYEEEGSTEDSAAHPRSVSDKVNEQEAGGKGNGGNSNGTTAAAATKTDGPMNSSSVRVLLGPAWVDWRISSCAQS
jgi:hypothetical protein